MASLAGYAAANSRTKPVLLFFDKKTNNTANAIYNTLLMQAIDSKERYIATLFGLDDRDIIISLDPNKYIEYIIQGTGIGGVYNIGAYYEFAEDNESDALVDLVERLIKYAESAEAYRNSVIS